MSAEGLAGAAVTSSLIQAPLARAHPRLPRSLAPPRDERPVEGGDKAVETAIWRFYYFSDRGSVRSVWSTRISRPSAGGGMRALAPPEGRPQQLPLYLNVGLTSALT